MPKALLINNTSKHFDHLRSLIPFGSDVLDWDHIGIVDTASYDIIILSGGSHVPPVAEYPEAYARERELIRTSKIPVIGICLGCEIIAYEFGGQLKDLGSKRTGFVQISFTDNPLPSFSGNTIIAYEAHSRIIEILPEIFEIVASSDHGPEVIRHHDRPIWGIQFHPEHLTERALGDEVFLAILKECLSSK